MRQEKQGSVYKLSGNAEVQTESYTFRADQMTYNSGTGDASAEGHVVLEGGLNDEHIEAARGRYNLRSEVGHFEDVRGTTGVRQRGQRVLLSSDSPFFFSGKVVEKTGPDYFVVYDGSITTCELPQPKWVFHTHRAVVEAGENASIYRSTFLIHGVPVLYLPYATHPIERLPRQSGFLIPSVGHSSSKGYIVGESVFWAINRSMDATIGAEYYSTRGWAQRGEFRARPSENSFAEFSYYGVLDRGTGYPPVDQGGEDVRLIAEQSSWHNFRAVANLDYLSSYVFRLAFYDTFSQAVNSEVRSLAFLSRTKDGFSFNTSADRYQNFESTTPDDVITILNVPDFDVASTERDIPHTPLKWSFGAAADGLTRSQPGFNTGTLLGRLDVAPEISLPLLLHGWSLRPDFALRNTFYSKQLVSSPTTGAASAVGSAINREALEASFEIRPPAVERLFENTYLGRRWKHVIEPVVTYNYVTGVDNFSRILRFDERDILSDTNEVEYRLINRLYAKRTHPKPEDCTPVGMPGLTVGGIAPQSRIPWEPLPDAKSAACAPGGQAREIVTWELAQKYFIDPTFGGALVPGVRNVFTTTADLTGIAFLTDQRRLSPLISRLRMQTTDRTDAEWDLDYDIKKGLINANTALLNYHTGPFTFAGGGAYLRTPGEYLSTATIATPLRFNQLRLLFGYGHANKPGVSFATNVGVDANLVFLQYAAAQGTYNWDCCGVTLEYRRFSLGSVRNENQFRFTFALANVGSFGNLRRQEKLY